MGECGDEREHVQSHLGCWIVKHDVKENVQGEEEGRRGRRYGRPVKSAGEVIALACSDVERAAFERSEDPDRQCDGVYGVDQGKQA